MIFKAFRRLSKEQRGSLDRDVQDAHPLGP
jgi:hypothetical protein